MKNKTILAAIVGLSLIGGCAIRDTTPGEEGNSRWAIDDGLCPGLSSGCDMSVPVAVGSDPHIDAFIERGPIINDLVVDVTGAGRLFELDRDSSARRIDLDIQTFEAGIVTMELLDRSGDVLDRASLEVREAADMECGVLESGDADWEMTRLTVGEQFTVANERSSADIDVEVGCRLLDVDGQPLLSARAIQWQVIESDDRFTIDNGGIGGGSSTEGARIYARFDLVGDSATVEASFDGMTRQIAIDTTR